MKKIILGVTAAVFLLFSGKFSAFGAENADYEYSIIGGEAVITGFKGEPTEFDIPEFIGCYPVTEVRDNAFCNCSSLKRIGLPDTVTKLGHHCFYACYSLESIALPEGLTEIGEGCFCGCTELVSVEITDTLEELPDSCFRACTSLKEIHLPSELQAVGAFCFAGCTALESAETGEKLLSIGDRAFFMCDKLNTIYIPPACTSIGVQAVGFTCEGNMELRRSDMLIRGCAGSVAEKYARDNGFDFFETEDTEDVFAVGSADEKNGDVPRFALLLGASAFVLLILLLLRIVFTDWSDQKLK